ncbi:hypothetical protein ABID65_003296 [Bradyrhizobium sp. S3.9.2]|uniref:hypothetical protein n=1 Tax=Bradyrhizobium sp. S3.9.2 TaxID=3156432 RepID=UPI003395851B
MKGRPKIWTGAEDDHLLFLRDREKLTFEAIAARFGRSRGACKTRYYYDLQRRNGARHYTAADRAARRGDGYPVPPELGEGVPALRLPSIGERIRMPSLDALREQAELRLRIAERGLTGGVFGDPPPGRSALDQRANGLAAPLQPSLPGRGSDVG